MEKTPKIREDVMNGNVVLKNSCPKQVNMLRPPYNKEFPNSYKMQGPFDDLQEDIDILFDTYLENANAFKAGKIQMMAEDSYKILGIPGPSQYRAFCDFFKLISGEEFYVFKRPYFYINDLDQCKDNENYESPTLEFVKNIRNYDFGRQKKEIFLASGSFCREYPNARKKMIVNLNYLYEEMGIKVHLYTQAKPEEEHLHGIIKEIKETSKFGLKKRIPIHFIRCGDYVLLEFPHTEQLHVRLDWLLDINKLEIKPDKTKKDIFQFFDNLIHKASN